MLQYTAKRPPYISLRERANTVITVKNIRLPTENVSRIVIVRFLSGLSQAMTRWDKHLSRRQTHGPPFPFNTLSPTKIQPINCLQTHIGSAWYLWRQLAYSQFQGALGRSCLRVLISDQALQFRNLPLTILEHKSVGSATTGYYYLDHLIQLPSHKKVSGFNTIRILYFLFFFFLNIHIPPYTFTSQLRTQICIQIYTHTHTQVFHTLKHVHTFTCTDTRQTIDLIHHRFYEKVRRKCNIESNTDP